VAKCTTCKEKREAKKLDLIDDMTAEARKAELLDAMIDAVAREAVAQEVGSEGLLILVRCMTETRPRPVGILTGFTVPGEPGADEAMSAFAGLVKARMLALRGEKA